MENPIIDTIISLAAILSGRERIALALTLIDVESQVNEDNPMLKEMGYVPQEDRIDNACAFLQAVRVPPGQEKVEA